MGDATGKEHGDRAQVAAIERLGAAHSGKVILRKVADVGTHGRHAEHRQAEGRHHANTLADTTPHGGDCAETIQETKQPRT